MLPTLAEAVQTLRCYQLPCTISRASSYLRGVRTKAKLLGLYQHFFPAEFEASTATLTSTEAREYSEREMEFLGLVNDKLFPMPELYNYLGEEERWFDSIPVTPDTCDWYERFDEWSLGWQLLLVLEGTVFEHFFDADDIGACDKTLVWAIGQMGEPRQVEAKRLAEHSKSAGEPLCFLPEAIAEIQYATGNLWLDVVLEWGHTTEEHEWTIENVRGLANLWREAKQIQAHTTALTKWIEADPKAHFLQILELWKSSQAH